MRFSFLFFTILAAVAVLAQESAPELTEATGKYKAAVESLEKSRGVAFALAAKPYLSLLDSIEKSATANGDVDLVAALVKERAAAMTGALEGELPAALPKSKLQGARKTLSAKVGKMATDFAKRRKQTEAEYLKALALLQTKAAPGSDLAKQVTAEKAALLEGTAVAKEHTGSQGKNAIANGNFEALNADGRPEGWDNTRAVTTEKSGNNTFIRFNVKSNDASHGLGFEDFLSRSTEVPEKAKGVTVSARMRTSFGLAVKRDGTQGPGVYIMPIDEKTGNSCWDWHVQAQGIPCKKNSWETFHSNARALPPNTKRMRIFVRSGQYPGTVDFDDVEVIFQ